MVLITWHLKGDGSDAKTSKSSLQKVSPTNVLLARRQILNLVFCLTEQLTFKLCFISVKLNRSSMISGTLHWVVCDTAESMLHLSNSGSHENSIAISVLKRVLTILCNSAADVVLYLGRSWTLFFLISINWLMKSRVFLSMFGAFVLLEVSPPLKCCEAPERRYE